MKAIVQKAKDVVAGETNIQHGLVVYLIDGSCYKQVLEKVQKLKIWNKWKESTAEHKYKTCIVLPENFELQEENTMQNVILVQNQSIRYTNDGPCTFIIK